jgi:hypothetical protein
VAAVRLDDRQHEEGVSSHEIGRSLDVTRKTAWFMLHRIRLAMQSLDVGKFGGEVDVDKTFHRWQARLGRTSPHEQSGKLLKLAEAWAGTYASVEPFHLFRYLDEQAFRYNNRRELIAPK